MTNGNGATTCVFQKEAQHVRPKISRMLERSFFGYDVEEAIRNHLVDYPHTPLFSHYVDT